MAYCLISFFNIDWQPDGYQFLRPSDHNEVQFYSIRCFVINRTEEVAICLYSIVHGNFLREKEVIFC